MLADHSESTLKERAKVAREHCTSLTAASGSSAALKSPVAAHPKRANEASIEGIISCLTFAYKRAGAQALTIPLLSSLSRGLAETYSTR